MGASLFLCLRLLQADGGARRHGRPTAPLGPGELQGSHALLPGAPGSVESMSRQSAQRRLQAFGGREGAL